MKEMQYLSYEDNTFPIIKVVDQWESDKTNYFFWNDDISTEDETKLSSSKAHSKGGLIFNKNSGVFISHSLPRFPDRTSKNEILDNLPSNAGLFGQHFICITLDKDNALKVVQTLNIINPNFSMAVDKDMVEAQGNPDVEQLIKNRNDINLPISKISKITSKGGNQFQIFSKNKKYENLPWDTEIPDFYQDGIFVRTWTRPKLIPNKCNVANKVINVSSVKFNDYSFSENAEHSKWGVGIKKSFCCFGDLNRTPSQLKRGGYVICFKNTLLASIMRKAVSGDKDSCNKVPSDSFLEYLEEETEK